jgi:hypothetical protein
MGWWLSEIYASDADAQRIHPLAGALGRRTRANLCFFQATTYNTIVAHRLAQFRCKYSMR